MTAFATSRIGARVSPELHQILKRAAQIQGRSLTDFLLTSAHQAALATIRENEIINISIKDQKIIADALFNPPKENEEMMKAFAMHGKIIKSK